MPKIDIDKLKRLRSDKGLTQPELAEKMGLKRSTYAYKEKIGEFTEPEIEQLVRFFQISITELEEVPNKKIHINGVPPPQEKGNPDTYKDKYLDSLEELRKKDKEIADLKSDLNQLSGELTKIARLQKYGQANNAMLRTALECLSLLRSNVKKETIEVAKEEIGKIYHVHLQEILKEDK